MDLIAKAAMDLQTLELLTLAAAEAGEAGSEGGVFSGSVYQSIAAIIVFLVVFFVLKAKAWGPILSGLQDREERIRTDLERAEAATREAQETLAKYRAELDQAQEQARQIIDKGRSDAEVVAAKVKKDAQDESKRIVEKARAEIEAAKEQALAEIYEKTADLATGVAAQILKREVKAADHQRLIDESLTSLKGSQN